MRRLTSIEGGEYQSERGLPKRGIPHIGFSDVSVINNLLGQRGVARPYYSTNIDMATPEQLADLKSILTETNPAKQVRTYDNLILVTEKPDLSQLKTLNGLPVFATVDLRMSSSAGTGYQFKLNTPSILAIESIDSPDDMGRMLQQAKESGMLNNVAAIVIGQGRGYGQGFSVVDLEKDNASLTQFIENSEIPIFLTHKSDTFGHGTGMLKAFANFAPATLKTDDGKFILSIAGHAPQSALDNNYNLTTPTKKEPPQEKAVQFNPKNGNAIVVDHRTLRMGIGTKDGVNNVKGMDVVVCSGNLKADSNANYLHQSIIQANSSGILNGAKSVTLAIPPEQEVKDVATALNRFTYGYLPFDVIADKDGVTTMGTFYTQGIPTEFDANRFANTIKKACKQSGIPEENVIVAPHINEDGTKHETKKGIRVTVPYRDGGKIINLAKNEIYNESYKLGEMMENACKFHGITPVRIIQDAKLSASKGVEQKQVTIPQQKLQATDATIAEKVSQTKPQLAENIDANKAQTLAKDEAKEIEEQLIKLVSKSGSKEEFSQIGLPQNLPGRPFHPTAVQVAIYTPNGATLSMSSGKRDWMDGADGKDIDDKTTFRIGSATKAITAGTFLALVDDDKYKEWLPNGMQTKLEYVLPKLQKSYPENKFLANLSPETVPHFSDITMQDFVNHTHGMGTRNQQKTWDMAIDGAKTGKLALPEDTLETTDTPKKDAPAYGKVIYGSLGPNMLAVIATAAFRDVENKPEATFSDVKREMLIDKVGVAREDLPMHDKTFDIYAEGSNSARGYKEQNYGYTKEISNLENADAVEPYLYKGMMAEYTKGKKQLIDSHLSPHDPGAAGGQMANASGLAKVLHSVWTTDPQKSLYKNGSTRNAMNSELLPNADVGYPYETYGTARYPMNFGGDIKGKGHGGDDGAFLSNAIYITEGELAGSVAVVIWSGETLTPRIAKDIMEKSKNPDFPSFANMQKGIGAILDKENGHSFTKMEERVFTGMNSEEQASYTRAKQAHHNLIQDLNKKYTPQQLVENTTSIIDEQTQRAKIQTTYSNIAEKVSQKRQQLAENIDANKAKKLQEEPKEKISSASEQKEKSWVEKTTPEKTPTKQPDMKSTNSGMSK
jgi:hypothetical protein